MYLKICNSSENVSTRMLWKICFVLFFTNFFYIYQHTDFIWLFNIYIYILIKTEKFTGPNKVLLVLSWRTSAHHEYWTNMNVIAFGLTQGRTHDEVHCNMYTYIVAFFLLFFFWSMKTSNLKLIWIWILTKQFWTSKLTEYFLTTNNALYHSGCVDPSSLSK